MIWVYIFVFFIGLFILSAFSFGITHLKSEKLSNKSKESNICNLINNISYYVLFASFLGTILNLFISLLVSNLILPSDKTYCNIATINSTTGIVSLADFDFSKRNDYLGCSGSSSNMCYYYIVKDVNGTMKIEKADADEVRIKYIGNNEIPHIDEYVYKKRQDSESEYLYLWNIYNASELYATDKFAYYVIYIPRGSITTDFNIDLQ